MSTPTRPLSGAVSRRTLLQGFAALGVGASLFGAAGCESAVSQSQASGSTDTPQRGGTIQAGIAADVIPGNFLTNSNTGVTTIVGLAYDFLIRYPNDKVEPTPSLATAWELAADGRSLTPGPAGRRDLPLRTSVHVQGRRVLDQDLRRPAVDRAAAQHGRRGHLLRHLRRAHDRARVQHQLGNIFDLLDTVPILDSETIEELRTGTKFVGTGPFTVTGWQPNTSISFGRNESYWVPERPYADAVEVKIITDAKALLAALKSGQIQYANGLSNLDMENLVKGDGFQRIRLEGAEKQLYVGSNVTAEAARRRPGPAGDRVRPGQGPGGRRGAPRLRLHRQPALAEVLTGLRRGRQQHLPAGRGQSQAADRRGRHHPDPAADLQPHPDPGRAGRHRPVDLAEWASRSSSTRWTVRSSSSS